jgi:hypothetical protein
MKHLQAAYDRANGEWLVRVPAAISDEAVNQIRKYLLGVQVDRLLATSAIAQPDKHKLLEEAIEALKNHRVAQVCISKGDVALFSSTERMTTKTYSYREAP